MKILFGERLKQLRKEAKLKQSQLAKELGTTQRKISYLESGQTEPDLYTLCMIADFFDVSADYLLGRRDY